jgi:hypothetical protein
MEGGAQEDHGSRPTPAKKFSRSHLNRKRLGIVTSPSIPAMVGNVK